MTNKIISLPGSELSAQGGVFRPPEATTRTGWAFPGCRGASGKHVSPETPCDSHSTSFLTLNLISGLPLTFFGRGPDYSPPCRHQTDGTARLLRQVSCQRTMKPAWRPQKKRRGRLHIPPQPSKAGLNFFFKSGSCAQLQLRRSQTSRTWKHSCLLCSAMEWIIAIMLSWSFLPG